MCRLYQEQREHAIRVSTTRTWIKVFAEEPGVAPEIATAQRAASESMLADLRAELRELMTGGTNA